MHHASYKPLARKNMQIRPLIYGTSGNFHLYWSQVDLMLQVPHQATVRGALRRPYN